MGTRIALVWRLLCAGMLASPSCTDDGYPGGVPTKQYEREMHALLAASPAMTFTKRDLNVIAPQPGWKLGTVSWIAVDSQRRRYLLQRGDDADPIVVIDPDGRVVRSWGAGLFVTPHAIRLDPQGNVWTVDAKTSTVRKFSPTGTELLDIEVGGVPADCKAAFCGATDVAFAPNGDVYVADGYRNARVVRFAKDGHKVGEFSTQTPGPGSFVRAHSIAIDRAGIIYVADRNNGRVQRFDTAGVVVGEWLRTGRPYALSLAPDGLWIASRLDDGIVIKMDLQSGRILEHIEIRGVHGLHAGSDELIVVPGENGIATVVRRAP